MKEPSNIEFGAVSWTESLLVKPAKRHGLGVFARRDFEKDEIIERVPCVEIPTEEMHFARMRGTVMHRYPMPGVPDPDHSAWMLGYGSLYNHEPDPQLANARWEWIGNRTLIFIANRNIAAGEEITYDYGVDTGF